MWLYTLSLIPDLYVPFMSLVFSGNLFACARAVEVVALEFVSETHKCSSTASAREQTKNITHTYKKGKATRSLSFTHTGLLEFLAPFQLFSVTANNIKTTDAYHYLSTSQFSLPVRVQPGTFIQPCLRVSTSPDQQMYRVLQ